MITNWTDRNNNEDILNDITGFINEIEFHNEYNSEISLLEPMEGTWTLERPPGTYEWLEGLYEKKAKEIRDINIVLLIVITWLICEQCNFDYFE
jgi:hypothetical protein